MAEVRPGRVAAISYIPGTAEGDIPTKVCLSLLVYGIWKSVNNEPMDFQSPWSLFMMQTRKIEATP